MSLFRSKKDFIAQFSALSEYIHTSQEPVFVGNEDGASDLVVLSMNQYEQMSRKIAIQDFMAGIDPSEKHPCVDVLAELDDLDE